MLKLQLFIGGFCKRYFFLVRSVSCYINIQLMYFCNDEGEVSYCPVDLEREFCILLEKASTLLERPDDRLLLIIDGADVITVLDHLATCTCTSTFCM